MIFVWTRTFSCWKRVWVMSVSVCVRVHTGGASMKCLYKISLQPATTTTSITIIDAMHCTAFHCGWGVSEAPYAAFYPLNAFQYTHFILSFPFENDFRATKKKRTHKLTCTRTHTNQPKCVWEASGEHTGHRNTKNHSSAVWSDGWTFKCILMMNQFK